MLICSTNAGSSENRSLLKELYDKYGRTVLGICYDILRSRHDSELAVQETFRFIYRTADSLVPHWFRRSFTELYCRLRKALRSQHRRKIQ